jgi:hypothetical protein
VVTEHSQTPPVGEFLFDEAGTGPGLQPQRVARQIRELAAVGIERLMKLGGERRERIVRIQREGGRGVEFRVFQAGAAMSAPQTLQVRCSTLP